MELSNESKDVPTNIFHAYRNALLEHVICKDLKQLKYHVLQHKSMYIMW